MKINYKKAKELIVKLKYVFPKDMYIFSGSHCLTGTISYNEIYGHAFAILDDTQKEVMESILNSSVLQKKGFAYITDMTSLKNLLGEENPDYTQYIKDVTEEDIIYMEDSLFTYLEKADKITEWNKFTEDISFIPKIFDDKGIYQLQIEGSEDSVRIGKPALPLISVKNADKYFYHIGYDDYFDLYELMIKYTFTHFQLYLTYNAVPMKKDI